MWSVALRLIMYQIMWCSLNKQLSDGVCVCVCAEQRKYGKTKEHLFLCASAGNYRRERERRERVVSSEYGDRHLHACHVTKAELHVMSVFCL